MEQDAGIPVVPLYLICTKFPLLIGSESFACKGVMRSFWKQIQKKCFWSASCVYTHCSLIFLMPLLGRCVQMGLLDFWGFRICHSSLHVMIYSGPSCSNQLYFPKVRTTVPYFDLFRWLQHYILLDWHNEGFQWGLGRIINYLC